MFFFELRTESRIGHFQILRVRVTSPFDFAHPVVKELKTLPQRCRVHLLGANVMLSCFPI